MANPNTAQLLQSTANTCAPAGCDPTPPAPVGLVLRLGSANGAPAPYPYQIPAGATAYLVVALDVDFRGTDLMLSGDLTQCVITSWTSNGVRDQNLLSETGIPAEVFAYNVLRRVGFDTAPTAARQQIVIEVVNQDPGAVAGIRGVIAGTCGNCNTTGR